MTMLFLKLLISLIVGAVFGAAFFGALECNVRLYCWNYATRLAPVIHVMRILGVALVFVGFAKLGAAPLLSAAAGLQLARIFAVRAKRPALEGFH